MPRRSRDAVAFVERLNGEDGLGGIYPAMANSVMMFDALGYAKPTIRTLVPPPGASVRKLLVVGERRRYCQPCLSPVWDTGLAGHALAEATAGDHGSRHTVDAACDSG